MRWIAVLLVTLSAQNQLPQQGRHPYYGKYLGMLTSDQYILGGVVWAASDNQILISDFTFQPPLFQLTNMTFVIGPNGNSLNRQYDLIPNANGSHLEPIAMKFEVLKVYKTITAKQPSAKETSEISLSGGGKRVKYDACGNVSHDSFKGSKGAAVPEPEPNGRPVAEPHRDSPTTISPQQTTQTATTSTLPTVTHNKNILVVNLEEPIVPTTTTKTTELVKRIWNRSVRDGIDNFIWRGDLITPPSVVANQVVTERQNCADGPVHSIPQTNEEVIDARSLVTSKPQIIGNGLSIDNNKPTERPFFLITAGSLGDATTIRPSTSSIGGTTEPQRLITDARVNGTDSHQPQPNISAVLKPTANDKEVHKDLEKVVNTTTLAPESNSSVLQPLSFHYHSTILLTLPPNKTVTDYKWLALWDNYRDNSIATIYLPNGPSFAPPQPVLVKGFTPATSFKDVKSGVIEIVDVKTIRIRDFYFEGDAPGAWFMVGQSVIPNALSGTVVPVLQSDGQFNCDFLQPSCNQTVTLKLPGNLEISDVFWLSVFCVPYSISFATRYLPYQDITVPADTAQSDIPNCQLK